MAFGDAEGPGPLWHCCGTGAVPGVQGGYQRRAADPLPRALRRAKRPHWALARAPTWPGTICSWPGVIWSGPLWPSHPKASHPGPASLAYSVAFKFLSGRLWELSFNWVQ